MKKRFLSLALAVLLALAVVPGVSAAETTTKVLMMSNNPEEPFRIEAIEDGLLFADLPKDREFDFVSISLNTDTESKLYMVFKSRGAENQVSYSLSEVPDGIYYIQLYRSPDRNETYWSYIWQNRISIRISNHSAEFLPSPVYEKNLTIRSQKRSDPDALAFYRQATSRIQSDNAEIIALANEITQGIDGDYAKLKAVHDWVCSNIWYDYDADDGRAPGGDTSAYGTLQSKRSVCEGYSSLTAALLRAVGIPAKEVSGYGGSDWTPQDISDDVTNHAWNEAYVDGRWIIIDTTWDSNNKYENGVYSTGTTGTGLKHHQYFDPTIEAFSYDHMYVDYSEGEISSVPDSTSTTPATATAQPSNQAMTVDGAAVNPDRYNINGSNYFKIRDLAMLLNGTAAQFEIEYANGAINILPGRAYTPVGGELGARGTANVPATLSTDKLTLNGAAVTLTAYKINGSNYFKIVDVGAAFGFGVAYDEATRTVVVRTSD
jgi:hypothetical protein